MGIDFLNAAVRPIVTLMLVGVLCYGFVTEKVGGEAFLSVVGMVVTFWFSQRQTAKDSAPPPPAPNNGGQT